MSYSIGDPVMHWTYGFGQVVGLEERSLSGKNLLYYAVKVRDMTIWVPADEQLEHRLRAPLSASGFKKMLHILSGPGNPLPEDRHERKTRLSEMLQDGRAESLCRVIRDLTTLRTGKPFNDNDQMLLNRAQSALLGEWCYSLSIPEMQAARDLSRLLHPETAGD